MMHMNKKTGRAVFLGVYYLIALILVLFFLFPFAVMLLRSVMPGEEVMSLPVKIIPGHLYFGAFREALDAELLAYARNTLIVLAANVIIIPLSASFVAFGFSKIKFKGRELFFGIVLATLMMPAISVQIPLYIIYSKIGLVNSLWALIIPAAFGGGAINIFLIRQFMRSIPNDLDNAGKIDGANLFRIYRSIYLPLCKPIILYIVVTTFLGIWNDFMGPLIYLNDAEKYTLAVGIYNKFVGSTTLENLPNIQMATGFLMLLPCAVIFFIFQKQLIEGVIVTGIKG